MKLAELEHALDYTLPAPSILYRVQRQRARSGALSVGALRLPPRGLMAGRFDLPDDDVGYFADSAESAVYETLARREATSLSLSALGGRALLTMKVTTPLQLLDLRPHAAAWPVLQSLRYGATQGLAMNAKALGYNGIVYRSAQQYGADCFAVFGSALKALRLESKLPLVNPATGGLHRAAATAIRGSKVPLVP